MLVVIKDIVIHWGEIFISTIPGNSYADKEIDASFFINYVTHHIDFQTTYSTFKAA